ncbi:MAG: hypothetical protein R3E58_16735 [Phycisphaerae bacterium]
MQQVEQILQLVFPATNVLGRCVLGEVREPAPMPDAWRVTVAVQSGCHLSQVREALDRCKGTPRTEVAESIRAAAHLELVFTINTYELNHFQT